MSDGDEIVNNTENGAAWRRPFTLQLNSVLSFCVLVCLNVSSIEPAAAENSGVVDRYTGEYTASRADAKPDALGAGPLFAVVSLADQRISLYGSGGLIARAPVSTGMRSHATPTGVFSIVQKRRWHESNIYSGAPMPFMQRITWSGIALHAGALPGHPASHGCIRLSASFAQRLFSATEIGQRVIISPADTSPIEITHKTLPVPNMSPRPGAAVASASADLDATGSVRTAPLEGGAVLASVSLHDAPAEPERLNPIEFAQALKSEAGNKARSAVKATKAAMLLSVKKAAELRLAGRKLAATQNAADDAADELAAAVRRLEKADPDETIAEAAEAKSAAEAALIQVRQAAEARIVKATEAKEQAEAALIEAQKTAEEARVAKAAEAPAQAEAPFNEVQKPAEEAPIVKASEAKSETEVVPVEAQKTADEAPVAAPSEAELALIEAQKTADEARIAEAAEAKSEAEEALDEARRVEDVRIAKATAAMGEAQEDLTEARRVEDVRIAKATAAMSEAEADIIAAHKAEEERIAKAAAAKSGAEAALIEAQKAAEEARAANDARQQELTAARNEAAEAKIAGKAAAAALAEASRRLKPLSVFISRKTGRLYVRQDFEPLFDVPVSIRDADREIGTHLYVSARAAPDGASLHWQAVSMPAMAEASSARREGKRRGDSQDHGSIAAAPAPMPETAHGALDRVTIAEDTSRRLAELAWVGASVIISDYGISGETGPTTDFIILTKSRASAR